MHEIDCSSQIKVEKITFQVLSHFREKSFHFTVESVGKYLAQEKNWNSLRLLLEMSLTVALDRKSNLLSEISKHPADFRNYCLYLYRHLNSLL